MPCHRLSRPRVAFFFAITLGGAALFAASRADAESQFIDGVEEKPSHLSGYAHVKIFGTLTRQDLKQLPSLIIKAKARSKAFNFAGEPNLHVFLDSIGGDVLAAIEMGRILRNAAAHTWVPRGSECSSACIFLLASGVERRVSPGAKIGLHRPFFEQSYFSGLSRVDAQRHYAVLIERSAKYLRDMGIADELFQQMLRIPSQKVSFVDSEYAERVGLTGEDPAYAEWNRANLARQNSSERLRQLDKMFECMSSGLSSPDLCGRFVIDK